MIEGMACDSSYVSFHGLKMPRYMAHMTLSGLHKRSCFGQATLLVAQCGGMLEHVVVIRESLLWIFHHITVQWQVDLHLSTMTQ
jgi:hypothetical protein